LAGQAKVVAVAGARFYPADLEGKIDANPDRRLMQVFRLRSRIAKSWSQSSCPQVFVAKSSPDV
jgi:hypothetical protein